MNPLFVNVTIPVYNEERALASSVGKVVEFLKKNCRYSHEVVIANNGSTDRTQPIAEELSRQFSVVRVEHLTAAGRGRAIKKVWSQSQADILSYMDVDLSTDLSAFPPLVDSLIVGGFDIATGSRRLPGSVIKRGFRREFFSWGYHVLLRMMFHTNICDAQCGFKAITRNVADELLPLIEDNGWLMDAELLILAERLGYRVYELPVCWVEDTDTRVRVGRDILSTVSGLMRLRCTLGDGKRYRPLSARLRDPSFNEDPVKHT